MMMMNFALKAQSLFPKISDQPVTLKFKNKTYTYDNRNGIREHANYSHLPINKKNNLYCLNCNKKGHNHKNCRFPTNSYGCVFFKKFSDHQTRYLMIQRKYTSAYIEILRAKYYNDNDNNNINHQYLILLILSLPLIERYYIETYDFDHLWNNLWKWVGTDGQMQCIYEEYENSKKKFDLLKQGSDLNFTSLFSMNPTVNMESDWEFPKGRRNEGESDYDCAIRESFEETTLNIADYKIFLHVKPFQEKFTSINQVRYCNSYYLAEVINENKCIYYDPNQTEQNKEIRKIGWFTEKEIHKMVNSNYRYRLRMISDIDNLVLNLGTKST